MNIFVAKLSYQTEEDQLRQVFENYGEVDTVKIVWDREQNRSKGFGFVEMPDDNEAKEAIEALNDSDLDGRTIVVKKAEPRPQGGGGGFRRDNNSRSNRY
jgi:RNA recognition motif-containing protein